MTRAEQAAPGTWALAGKFASHLGLALGSGLAVERTAVAHERTAVARPWRRPTPLPPATVARRRPSSLGPLVTGRAISTYGAVTVQRGWGRDMIILGTSSPHPPRHERNTQVPAIPSTAVATVACRATNPGHGESQSFCRRARAAEGAGGVPGPLREAVRGAGLVARSLGSVPLG